MSNEGSHANPTSRAVPSLIPARILTLGVQRSAAAVDAQNGSIITFENMNYDWAIRVTSQAMLASNSNTPSSR